MSSPPSSPSLASSSSSSLSIPLVIPIAAPSSTSASSSSSSSSSLFKKKSTKRKEFRAPAQSLAGGAAAASASSDKSSGVAATPAERPIVEDEIDEDMQSSSSSSSSAPPSSSSAPSSSSSSAPSSSSSSSSSSLKPSSSAADDDDDDDADNVRPSASSLAAAVAAAAEVLTSDPEEDDNDEGDNDDVSGIAGSSAVMRQVKKKAKTSDNDFGTSTRDKLKKDHQFTIKSDRSTAPDLRTNDHKITQVVNSSTPIIRDPTKSKWSGPSKPNASNVKMISRFDYQPDICKDYKDTGRCGYGDGCVFMHDRGDYRAGWQIENDWNKTQEEKRKRVMAGGKADEDEVTFEVGKSSSSSDDLPWACAICKDDFVSPVMSKCKHYFCESCALASYIKDTKCAVCRQQTGGIFNTANDIIDAGKRRAKTAGSNPKERLEEEARERKEHQEKRTIQAGWRL